MGRSAPLTKYGRSILWPSRRLNGFLRAEIEGVVVPEKQI